MTEAEWLVGGEPRMLMYHLQPTLSGRKSRLFVVGICRAAWSLLTDLRSRTAIDVAERVADGLATESERCEARRSALVAEQEMALRRQGLEWRSPEREAFDLLLLTAQIALNSTRLWLGNTPSAACHVNIGAAKVRSLTECVLGNPFRPFAVDTSWLTSTAVALAEGIYGEKAFDRLPILADALMDAGCANDDVLNHCRGDGPHVRGCWVVDLLTGR